MAAETTNGSPRCQIVRTEEIIQWNSTKYYGSRNGATLQVLHPKPGMSMRKARGCGITTLGPASEWHNRTVQTYSACTSTPNEFISIVRNEEAQGSNPFSSTSVT
jgi:hypothetical protein